MSFGIMGLSAAFAKAGCAHKKKNVLRVVGGTADPTIMGLSCVGNIIITSTKNGETIVRSYANLSDTQVSVLADANTEIIIEGDVTLFRNARDYGGWVGFTSITEFDCSKSALLESVILCKCTSLTSLNLSANTALTSLDCRDCTGLTALDLSANTALTSLHCGACTGLTTLDLSANTALTSLECYACTGLTTLDLSANTALTSLVIGGSESITTIKYPATNEDVSTVIADVITDATAADGTVYTDSAGAYYSTIATAATAKGWTIEQL